MDARTFAALAEPARVGIVELLRDGPRTVGEVAAALALRQPQASKHLRTLADAGLVQTTRVGARTVCELRQEPFDALATWIDHLRPTWDERLDAMERYLADLRAAAPGDDHHDDRSTP